VSAKNGSFGFAQGRGLCEGAKPNPAKSGQVVPFMDLQKNFKIFVRV